ncbi:hypothetical protein WJX73_008231 [Symbiochloris irregularis]|uniref:Uncharacterized protein n=1 Tax=Symbiochloris irregularis TaxID=706552 RepID=A0AAW1NSC9_9CHLO
MAPSASGQVVVLDDGGSTIKVGLAGQSDPARILPNATGKVKGGPQLLIGDDIDAQADISSLSIRRPIEKGYVVNWKAQAQIIDRACRGVLPHSTKGCSMLLTEPLFTLPAIQEARCQAVFETLGCQALLTLPAPLLALTQHCAEVPNLPASRAHCGVVVDAGFSFTHVVPIFDGKVMKSAVRRIDLGGKALTNYLTELVSYRSMDMREEAYLMEHIKNAISFVSTDLKADLVKAKTSSKLKVEYVLPDGLSLARGFVREPVPLAKGETRTEQVLVLNNERFLVPELIFSPSDIGLQQAGLPQMVADSVMATHPDLWPLLFSNVVVCGGLATCPDFQERLLKDLRPLVPDHIKVDVWKPKDPIAAAWQGGSRVGASAQFAHLAMTKADYEEDGIR